jgi:hypothetical protein
MDPLRTIQTQHLRNTLSREAVRRRDEPRKTGNPSGWTESPTHTTGEAANIVNELGEMGEGSNWLWGRCETQILAELRARPAFLYEARDVQRLRGLLLTCHLAQPVVHFHVARRRELPAFESIFQAVTKGVTIDAEFPFQARGQVMATMDTELFRELLADPGEDTGLVNGTIWLTGTALGGEGMSVPPPEQPPSCMQKLYTDALPDVLERRMQETPITADISADTFEAICQFIDELKTLESRAPGITNSLHHLVPTLYFAFWVLYSYHKQRVTQPPQIPVNVITEFAGALARRMVAFKQRLLQADRVEWLCNISMVIGRKLQDGPKTHRQICRSSHRLSTADCLEALEHLQSVGRAEPRDGQWHLVTPASLMQIELEPAP